MYINYSATKYWTDRNPHSVDTKQIKKLRKKKKKEKKRFHSFEERIENVDYVIVHRIFNY